MKFTKGVISVQLFFKFVYVFVGLFNEKIVHNDSCFCFCSCTLWTQLNSSKTFMPWKLRHFAFKRYCCFFLFFLVFVFSLLLFHFCWHIFYKIFCFCCIIIYVIIFFAGFCKRLAIFAYFSLHCRCFNWIWRANFNTLNNAIEKLARQIRNCTMFAN